MKKFLIVTAVIELGAGAGFIALPSWAGWILFGVPVDTTVGLLVARLGGSAVLALVLACWLARNDGKSRAAFGIVWAMLLYNIGAVMVLTYAGIGMRLFGIALWPAVVAHAAMTIWCLACLFWKVEASSSQN